MRNSACLTATLAVLAAASSSSPASAQNVHVAIQEGDHILTLANVRNILSLYVNDNGVWYGEVSTDLGDNTRDNAILRNGFLSLQEGTLLANPVGAHLQAFNDISVNSSGQFGWPFRLRDTAGGNSDNEGIFWNTVLLGQKGFPVDSIQVPSGTEYQSFKVVRINDDNTLLTSCVIQDPTITGQEDALIMLHTDGAGHLLTTNVIYEEGDAIPVIGGTVSGVGSSFSSIALNNNGQWMAQVKVNGATTTTDTALLIDGFVVLREGDPASQEGRFWDDMNNPSIDMNNFGDWVWNGGLNFTPGSPEVNDNAIIVKNGEKFVQETDSFPAIAPFQLTRFASSPVFIGDSGDVFWYGEFNNPDGNADTAYFRNKTTIVREGQMVDGNVVINLFNAAYSTNVSPSGRYWVGRVLLQSIGDALLYADFGLVVPIPGCTGNAGTLEATAGAAVAGGNLTLAMNQGQAVGVTPFLFFSTSPAIPGSNCGINTLFGELLIRLGPARLGTLAGVPWNGNPSLINVNIPADPGLVDLVAYGQGLFWDLAGVTGGTERFRLTNAIKMEIGGL